MRSGSLVRKLQFVVGPTVQHGMPLHRRRRRQVRVRVCGHAVWRGVPRGGRRREQHAAAAARASLPERITKDGPGPVRSDVMSGAMGPRSGAVRQGCRAMVGGWCVVRVVCQRRAAVAVRWPEATVGMPFNDLVSRDAMGGRSEPVGEDSSMGCRAVC